MSPNKSRLSQSYFDGGRFDGTLCRNRQCRWEHFLQDHPATQKLTKRDLKNLRREKKRARKKMKRKIAKDRKGLEKRKEDLRKKKRRTVGPIEFQRKTLPPIPTYDEMNLETQIRNFPCLGMNKMRVHNITKLNGTFEVSLDLMLDSNVVGKWIRTCATKIVSRL